MPRTITKLDQAAQEDSPIPVAERIERMELAKKLHDFRSRRAEESLPPCLEIITSPHGEAARIIAAHRMLAIYEMGYKVFSDSTLLFGERLLPDEIAYWPNIIRPGQALCLTDVWYNTVIPQVPGQQGAGSQDSAPSTEAWTERQGRINEQMVRMEDLLHQGCHVVLALAHDIFLPAWSTLVDAPIVLVTATEEAKRNPDGVVEYVTTRLEVEELTGGDANLNPPMPHAYDRLTPQMLVDSLILTSVINPDRDMETP